MKRFYGIAMLLLVLLMPSTLSAQSLDKMASTPTDFSNFVTNSFINYYTTGGVQEKLYLVTDKPFYSAGDTIYFSAFLVNSIYFNRTTDSKFIYVELIDATGNVTHRLRVMGSDGRFYNAIPLSTKTTAGKYTLRAYSKWQTNSDKELLFSRQLEIGNYIDDAVRTNIKYEFDGSGKVVASVEVTSNSFVPIPDNTVEYSLSINGRTTRHMTKTDKDGFFRFSFRPSTNMSDCIRMNINANGRKLDKKVQLPSFENDFSAKFLPEGGNLIANLEQTVAFKAVGIDGKAVEVEGIVQTKTGVEICTIRSEHSGMGKFTIKAQEGETYIATLSTKDGISRSFTLPEAKPIGCVLHLQPEEGDRALLQIHTTASYPRENLVAVIQSRGIVNYVVEDLSHALRIPLNKLRSGVAQVSIVDKTTRSVVAQRLFFVRGKVAEATITPSVNKFSPRERVLLNFNVKNSAGAAVKGDFVVSVTDAELLKEVPNSDNIFSYMLLNSELKGHIENPKYYFEADDAKHNEHLDLVMLTHGWRRYDIDAILAGKKPFITQPFEKEQSISGGIKSTIGKTRNTSVMIFRNRKEYLGVHDLNSTNRFFITGVDSPDTTVYILQALNRNGSSDRVRIKVDPQIYPMAPTIARESLRKEVQASLTEEYMVRSKNTYFEDGGEPVIDIDVVEVIAKRSVTYDYSSSLNDFNTVSGDMSRFVSIFDALQRFRQLEVEGNNVYVRTTKMKSAVRDEASNNTDSEENNFAGVDIDMDDKVDLMPAVYVNGTQMDMGVIDAYPMSEVISVSYLDKFESMAAGMGSETGAIILHVKDINAREKFLINSMAEVVVPGYATPMEFYAPDYSVENDKSKRDNRTTIAWVPSLQSTSMGDAVMSFWTADRQSNYRVIIEGITSEGELLYNEIILQSK
ncbi:MAG: hypothetical protein IIV16_02465 [Alistipes sp.]|nr:hypothetical protein [Alistipes sp.]